MLDLTIPGFGRLELTDLVCDFCGAEGAAAEPLQVCDIVVGRIVDALDLLLHPNRLVATLRA